MTMYDELKGTALDAYRQSVGAIKAKGEAAVGAAAEIITRPLRPEDLGLATSEWTFNLATGAAWNTIVNAYALPTDKWIAIHGLKYAQSGLGVVTQIRITRKGSLSHIWNIQGMQYNQVAAIYSDQIPVCDATTSVTIEAYATAVGATEKLVFLGTIAEKRGALVNP